MDLLFFKTPLNVSKRNVLNNYSYSFSVPSNLDTLLHLMVLCVSKNYVSSDGYL
jgi:hypothetical protein